MIAKKGIILPGLLGIMIAHSRETYQPTSIINENNVGLSENSGLSENNVPLHTMVNDHYPY